jgi:signal transduction histidine kinase
VPEDDRGDEVGELAGEFNRMLERLERAAASNREFMAAVSHELRTPITIARGHIETLEAIGLDDRAAVEEVTTVVREELLHMGRLVADLMALARSESEDFIQPGRVELPALFAELRLRLAGLALEDVTVGEALDVAFAADADRLAQALLNLVVNADVHTPAGTAVRVDAVLESGAVVFTVGDDGPGMDSSVRHEAFRPVVTSGTVHGSTGLGLAVVRAVAEGHGGSVGLETGPEGTTVTLRVPALVATAHSATPAAAG